METLYLTDEDHEMVVLVGCSLDRSPGSNWVEKGGGLPEYICRIARAIHRSGRPIGQAISIAVSRVKKWAAGLDDVDADTRAKAAKAVAEWEALKAKNKVKKGAKNAAGAGRGKGRDGDKADMSTVDSDLDRVMLAASRHTPRSDLDAVLLAAGKPNPFAKGGAKGGAKGTDKGSGGGAKPYGNVTYADPGYKGGKKRYPIDTAAHVRAAWSYVNQEGNQSDYTSEQVAAIKAKIKAAAKKLGVEISGD